MLSNVRWHQRPFPLHRKPGECDAWARTRPALLSSPLIIFLLFPLSLSLFFYSWLQPLDTTWLTHSLASISTHPMTADPTCMDFEKMSTYNTWYVMTLSDYPQHCLDLKIRINCYILFDCPTNHNCVAFCLDLICHTIDWTQLCLSEPVWPFNAALVLTIYFTWTDNPHTR